MSTLQTSFMFQSSVSQKVTQNVKNSVNNDKLLQVSTINFCINIHLKTGRMKYKIDIIKTIKKEQVLVASILFMMLLKACSLMTHQEKELLNDSGRPLS